jgi:SAM-dependent methyltransferase
VTVASYDAAASEYATATATLPDLVRTAIGTFVDSLPGGARVLEVGSGSGRDARALEDGGLSVRRTDITPGFVALLRSEGYAADVVDPLRDDLSDPDRDEPYDAVWASASLLHVRREDLPDVLRNLARVTRADGLLHLTVKEGDGARFDTHGVVGPRHFTFWREEPLRAVLEEAGWKVDRVDRGTSVRGEDWLEVRARRT